MSGNAKIHEADIASLEVIRYPDPRLREASTPVDEVDESVRRLIEKMFELMFEAAGVGLAAAQVGITARLFVASPSFDQADRQVYINPQIIAAEGSQESDEGCLSFPGIICKVKRPNVATIRATNLDGEVFEQAVNGLAARILLHELDHLDGRLLVDRMGSVAKLTNRRALKDLQDQFTTPGSR